MPRLRAVVLRCANPAGLVAFWTAATGLRPVPEDQEALDAGTLDADESIELGDPAGAQPSLWLTPPAAGDASGRMHLDVLIEEPHTLEHLAECGGTKLTEVEEHGDRWTVFADPEGNRLCAVHGW